MSSQDMLAGVLEILVDRVQTQSADFDAHEIEDVHVGVLTQIGDQGANVARVAQLMAKNIPDIGIYGDPSAWKCLCKAWSKQEGWMKSTKVLEIPNIGCLVQVSTQQWNEVAEAIVFVPKVRLRENEDGYLELVAI